MMSGDGDLKVDTLSPTDEMNDYTQFSYNLHTASFVHSAD
jgi:hypothetical protein